MLRELHDDETLDDLDLARASEMEERPIYAAVILVVVAETREPEEEEVAA